MKRGAVLMLLAIMAACSNKPEVPDFGASISMTTSISGFALISLAGSGTAIKETMKCCL